MKATELLESQHRRVESLFEKLESGDFGALTELANDLVAHMTIEQEIFYPAVRSKDPQQVSESFEEHAIAELALKRLLATDPNDEKFGARVNVLEDLIRHHVEEEENELFPTVVENMSEEEHDALGERMKTLFEDVSAADDDGKFPKGFDETSADRAQANSDERAHGEREEARPGKGMGSALRNTRRRSKGTKSKQSSGAKSGSAKPRRGAARSAR